MIFDIKKQIALKIGLSELEKAGTTIIRDDNGFRINQKEIEYFWILTFNHLNGFDNYGLFTIKIDESNFREFENSKEIITGIFSLNNNKIDLLYFESDILNFEDKIADKFNDLDLFYKRDLIENEVPSIIELIIESKNISAKIDCQYIENQKWAEWNNAIIQFSKLICQKSKNNKLKQIVDVY